jgi:hypothetical protein
MKASNMGAEELVVVIPGPAWDAEPGFPVVAVPTLASSFAVAAGSIDGIPANESFDDCGNGIDGAGAVEIGAAPGVIISGPPGDPGLDVTPVSDFCLQ